MFDPVNPGAPTMRVVGWLHGQQVHRARDRLRRPPPRLAQFWCAVLGYEVQDEEDGVVAIGSPLVPDGKATPGPVPPTLTFASVPGAKTIKNRLHLDLNPTDRSQAEEVRRLLGLGARHVDVGQGDQSWVVLADPEGNEFCVLATRCP
ncbi:MAG: VOC family protein [Nocardioides sp.]|uniref:VOC family protein n=1 Tax=Nocardioides sp. TaxID=35761 RepID=UPI0039E6D1BF